MTYTTYIILFDKVGRSREREDDMDFFEIDVFKSKIGRTLIFNTLKEARSFAFYNLIGWWRVAEISVVPERDLGMTHYLKHYNDVTAKLEGDDKE